MLRKIRDTLAKDNAEVGWKISCNIKWADEEVRHIWLSTKYATHFPYEHMREQGGGILQFLNLSKMKKKSSGLLTTTIQQEKKKNPIAKVLVSYLGSWVQSLTCQQPLGGQFFALLYLSNLFSFTSLSVKWVYWHFSTAGVWGKEVPRFNRALKELFLKSWLFPILLRIFWCACNRR